MADRVPAPHRSATDFFSDPLDAHSHWLKPDLFHYQNFDSETYITDIRTFVPFDTLRSELQSQLSFLNYELTELVNRDYADFVSLSTKLGDVDAALVLLRAPLVEFREKIKQFRGSVESSLVAMKNGLKQRSKAAKARQVLEVLLDTFHVVSKVEKLIKELPSVPAEWSNGDANLMRNSMNNRPSLQFVVDNGTNLRETQSMLLERISSEMNRLKFYIAHGQNLPFIENMEKRIQGASLLLDASLGHCFVDGLEHRDANAIYNCLCAYAAVDKTMNAEEIFRTTVITPLLQKIIPHGPSAVASGSSGDELQNDYMQIKKCIDRDCKFLLEISFEENSGLHVFDFLANSILKEVLSAIQKEKPGAFSPVRPTKFLKNYKSSLDFLVHLEGYCPSRSAVAKFRAQAVYNDFVKQWNIGVYFSLSTRFQEIARTLDSALASTSLVPVHNERSGQGISQDLTLKQSVTLLNSLQSCWEEDVFVLTCADKFLRLSLQLLSRYSNWLTSGLAARKMGNAGSNSGTEWAISAVPDDFIIHDLNCLAMEVQGDYLEHILQLLSSCPADVLDLVKQSISQGGESLNDLIPLVINTIIVEKSDEDLRQQLKGITATYMLPNKPLPVRHSPYVPGILLPLKAFLEGERATKYFTEETKSELLIGAAIEITSRYYKLASELVSKAKKWRLHLDVSDNNISYTEKICMQLSLDIQEYGRNLASLGVDAASISAYQSLWQIVN